MRKQYVITRMEFKDRKYLVYAVFDENGRLFEISVSPEDGQELLGNIYIGKVKDVAEHVDAAFVEIAPGKRCFLSRRDLKQPIYTKKIGKKPICQDEELVVQVVRDAVKTKVPEVSTNLNLEGQFLVLTTGNTKLGVSNKLQKDVAQALKEAFLQGVEALRETEGPELSSPNNPGNGLGRDFGCILRTNAAAAPMEEVLAEYEALLRQYHELAETAVHKTVYSLLRQAKPFYMKELEGIPRQEEAELVTDCPDVYTEITGWIENNTGAQRRDKGCQVRLYQDESYPLYKLYSLEKHIQEACSEQVWLKSGAYLVITPAEALTVIDVNSGRQSKGKSAKENFRRINLEAAEEIARQLRIRNISGICVVDFINLDTKEAEAELMEHFRQALKEDRVPVQLVDITKLGLVELTRKKVKRSLAEQLKKY